MISLSLIMNTTFTEFPKMNKILILSALTIHNAIIGLLMRHSRIRTGQHFIPASAIVSGEVVKLIASLFFVYKESSENFINTLLDACEPKMLLQMAIPSAIYLAQNNLLYVAATHLDTAIFQVTYQSRILMTAMLSKIILNKILGCRQWVSLLILMMGIVTVNLSVLENQATDVKENSLIGIGASFLGAGCSSFAGVYLESKFKTSNLWVRNFQLALVSVPAGVAVCLIQSDVNTKGFFYGYDALTGLIIFLMSVGGFLVAIVIKYADNILKGFATSLTICLTAIASYFLFDVELNWLFGIGAVIVVGSIALYSFSPAAAAVDTPTKVQSKDVITA